MFDPSLKKKKKKKKTPFDLDGTEPAEDDNVTAENTEANKSPSAPEVNQSEEPAEGKRVYFVR